MTRERRPRWLAPDVRAILDLAADTLDEAARRKGSAAHARLLVAADGLLRAACQAADPRATLWSTLRRGHQTYELRRRVVRAFRAIHPRHAGFALFPETRLTMPPGLPPPPPGEAEYARLRLQNEDVVRALLEAAPADVPDGALPFLCEAAASRRSAEEVLARVGLRARVPALWHLSVCGPSAFQWEGIRWPLPDDPYPDAPTATSGGPPEAAAFYRLAAGWPDPEAEEFFRLSLEAGWNDAWEVPDREGHPGHRASVLKKAFRDGPYVPQPGDALPPGGDARSPSPLLTLAARALSEARRTAASAEEDFEGFDWDEWDAAMCRYAEERKRVDPATRPVSSPADVFDVTNAKQDLEGFLAGAAGDCLQASVLALETARPELRGHPARHEVMTAFRARYPELAEVTLAPEPRLRLAAGAPPPPVAEGRWERLRGGPGFDLRLYDELCALPPEALPEGALPALCSMAGTGQRFFLDLPAPSPDALLARYGLRARDAILDYLANPRAHGWEAACYHVSDWTPRFVFRLPDVLDSFFALSAAWPDEEAEAFFRLTLQAGWNHAGKYLPRDRYGPPLREEFRDSPHGPPLTLGHG